MVDGSTITDGDTLLDGYTGEPLNLDNYSWFNFDGVQFFRYQPDAQLLTVYDSNFARDVSYSTSNYLYNGAGSRFVSDNNGGKWFFGCGSDGCYKTEVKIVSQ
jgi:hypothetical protein